MASALVGEMERRERQDQPRADQDPLLPVPGLRVRCQSRPCELLVLRLVALEPDRLKRRNATKRIGVVVRVVRIDRPRGRVDPEDSKERTMRLATYRRWVRKGRVVS